MTDGTPLPAEADLRLLGLDPAAITSLLPLRHEHGHSVYRLTCGERSFVLKYFPNPKDRVELAAYELLGCLGVPTIAVHGRTATALLLEDLTTSTSWRLATRSDIDRPEVGTAVAEWYRLLHAAGRRLVSDARGVPSFLKWEANALDAAIVRRIGERLQLVDNPVWELAATNLSELQRALWALPTTLTCADFHWTNLALSREEAPAMRAARLDFHLLGIGPAYSDYRNVLSGLSESAQATFAAAYGDVDEQEAVLDAPLSILYSLSVAVEQPRLPPFGLPLLHAVTTGELERKLRQALAILPDG